MVYWDVASLFLEHLNLKYAFSLWASRQFSICLPYHFSSSVFFFSLKRYEQLSLWYKPLFFQGKEASFAALANHFPQPQSPLICSVPEKTLAEQLLFSLPLSCSGETVSRSSFTWQRQEQRNFSGWINSKEGKGSDGNPGECKASPVSLILFTSFLPDDGNRASPGPAVPLAVK